MSEDALIRTDEGWRFASRYLAQRTLGRPACFSGRIVDFSALDSSPLFG
jgi:hypothetical protein